MFNITRICPSRNKGKKKRNLNIERFVHKQFYDRHKHGKKNQYNNSGSLVVNIRIWADKALSL